MSAAEKVDFHPTFADLARERRIRALSELLKVTMRAGDSAEGHRLYSEMKAAMDARRPEFLAHMEREQMRRCGLVPQ